MERYLIAMDMDGTLLKDDKTINEELIIYLKTLKAAGHILVLASGRPMRTLLPYYKQLGLDTPMICFNGVHIFSPYDPTISFEAKFPHQAIVDLVNTLPKENIQNILCETLQRCYLYQKDEVLSLWFSQKEMEIVYGDIEHTLKEDPLTTILHLKRTDTLHALEKKLENYPSLHLRYWSGSQYPIAEIYQEGLNKATALKKVAAYYQIPCKHIIAFGDANNDVEMLAFAPHSFAMKNGTDDAKQSARYITDYSNEENGILHALRGFFRGKDSVC